MPKIELETYIKADIQIVFDLSRSIDLHMLSTSHTNEKAIAGRTSGLIELNDFVTWKAKHFGFYHTLTSKISEYDRPNYFMDSQVTGIFKYFRHEHHFNKTSTGTRMLDLFDYKSPLGVLGTIADKILVENYMTKLLLTRNTLIKEFAETNKWKKILN